MEQVLWTVNRNRTVGGTANSAKPESNTLLINRKTSKCTQMHFDALRCTAQVARDERRKNR